MDFENVEVVNDLEKVVPLLSLVTSLQPMNKTTYMTTVRKDIALVCARLDQI